MAVLKSVILGLLFVGCCLATEGDHSSGTESSKPPHTTMMPTSHASHEALSSTQQPTTHMPSANDKILPRRDLQVQAQPDPSPVPVPDKVNDDDDDNDDMKTDETFWWKYYGHGGFHHPHAFYRPNYYRYPYPYGYYNKWH